MSAAGTLSGRYPGLKSLSILCLRVSVITTSCLRFMLRRCPRLLGWCRSWQCGPLRRCLCLRTRFRLTCHDHFRLFHQLAKPFRSAAVDPEFFDVCAKSVHCDAISASNRLLGDRHGCVQHLVSGGIHQDDVRCTYLLCKQDNNLATYWIVACPPSLNNVFITGYERLDWFIESTKRGRAWCEREFGNPWTALIAGTLGRCGRHHRYRKCEHHQDRDDPNRDGHDKRSGPRNKTETGRH